MFVVSESESDVSALRIEPVELSALFKLPGDESDPVQVSAGEKAGEAA